MQLYVCKPEITCCYVMQNISQRQTKKKEKKTVIIT